jgi:HSP20 family protein
MEDMPWDPVRDLLTMQGRFESLFGQATPGWVPPVDLMERNERYVLTVELPGFTRADVTIEVVEQVLTVRGTRPAEVAGAERYQQLERGQGAFSRSFRFAHPIASNEITADMRDGVLTVTIPKAAASRRHIEVS